MRETENYLRRQLQVHRGIIEDVQEQNSDYNDHYLQRRMLNIEEIQRIEYASDEEERKFLEEVPNDNLEERKSENAGES